MGGQLRRQQLRVGHHQAGATLLQQWGCLSKAAAGRQLALARSTTTTEEAQRGCWQATASSTDCCWIAHHRAAHLCAGCRVGVKQGAGGTHGTSCRRELLLGATSEQGTWNTACSCHAGPLCWPFVEGSRADRLLRRTGYHAQSELRARQWYRGHQKRGYPGTRQAALRSCVCVHGPDMVAIVSAAIRREVAGMFGHTKARVLGSS